MGKWGIYLIGVQHVHLMGTPLDSYWDVNALNIIDEYIYNKSVWLAFVLCNWLNYGSDKVIK